MELAVERIPGGKQRIDFVPTAGRQRHPVCEAYSMSVSAHPFHSANDLTYSFQAQLMGSPDHKPGQRLFVALLQTCVSAAGDETKAGYYLSENDGADWKHCAGNQVPEGLRVFSTVSG